MACSSAKHAITTERSNSTLQTVSDRTHLSRALVFNLIYHRDIQSGMLLLFQNDGTRQVAKEILKDIQVNTSIYFGTLTVVNICLGIATTVSDLAGGAAASVPVGHACPRC